MPRPIQVLWISILCYTANKPTNPMDMGKNITSFGRGKYLGCFFAHHIPIEQEECCRDDTAGCFEQDHRTFTASGTKLVF